MKRNHVVPVLLASALLGLTVTAAATAQVGGCQSVSYSPFDPDDPRLSINGDAAVDTNDGTLDLTPPLNGQSGSVFTTDDVELGPDAAFSTRFSFQFTEANNGGADGMVFALQTVASNVGGGGGGIGYQGLEPSVGVEFDSWFNGGTDPDDNHVGINVDGNMSSNPTATPPGQLDGGGVFFAWVDYDGSTNLLEVRVATTDDRPDDPLISTTIDLAEILLATPDTEVFVGFTSGTGAANARHTVLTWEFANCLANLGAPPTAVDDAYTTDEDTRLNVPAPGFLANDVGVGLTITDIAFPPAEPCFFATEHEGGSPADGSFLCNPLNVQHLDDGDSVQDSFTYEITNADGSDEGTVVVTILGLNDPPRVNAGEDPPAAEVNQPVELAGAAADVDEGETLAISWTVDGPCTFSDPNSLTTTVTCSEAGTFTAVLTADDGDASAIDAVEITVVDTLSETGTSASALGIVALLLLAAGSAVLRLGRRHLLH